MQHVDVVKEIWGGGKSNFKISPFSSFRSFLKILSVLLLSIFLVTGCGGGSGGGDNAGGSAVKKVTGKVVYSGIQPNTDLDKVCYDKNSNKACDVGEPVAFVSDDGSYTIESSEDDAAKYSLVAELYGDKPSASSKILAKVKAGGTEQKPTTIFETPVGKSTISSITTVIKTKMDMGALSLAEAEQQTKKELFDIDAGTEKDADTDLFSASPSNEITVAAKKVADAMNSLLKTFEDNEVAVNISTLLFLMNTIVEQLEKIQQNQNVVLGKNGKDEIEKAADGAVSTKPTVQTAAEALKDKEILGYDARFEGETPKPYFQLYKFTTTKIAAPAGETEEWKIPGANTNLEDVYSAEVKGDNVVFIANKDKGSENRDLILTSVETVKLSGKSLRAAASYEGENTNGIEFSGDSVVHKMRLLFPDEQKVFEKDLKAVMDECYGENKRADYWCTDVKLDKDENPTKISDGFKERFEIMMRADNTYFIKPLTDKTRYSDEGGLFSERRPTRKGKYEKSGDDYIFKDEEGRVVFKVFKKQEQNQKDNSSSYIVAGHLFDDVHQVMYLFNETAAKQIKDQKDKFNLSK